MSPIPETLTVPPELEGWGDVNAAERLVRRGVEVGSLPPDLVLKDQLFQTEQGVLIPGGEALYRLGPTGSLVLDSRQEIYRQFGVEMSLSGGVVEVKLTETGEAVEVSVGRRGVQLSPFFDYEDQEVLAGLMVVSSGQFGYIKENGLLLARRTMTGDWTRRVALPEETLDELGWELEEGERRGEDCLHVVNRMKLERLVKESDELPLSPFVILCRE